MDERHMPDRRRGSKLMSQFDGVNNWKQYVRIHFR